MPDKDKTKEQLLAEINEYRSKIIELEKVNSEYILAKDKLSESENKYPNLEMSRVKDKMASLLDCLDAGVYVTDIKTYELLYINKYSRDIFGDVVGKICWQALQTDQTGPCDFCTNDKLLTPEGKPKGVYRWEFENTVNGRWYDIHDRAIEWIDGRIARMEIATDITERKMAEKVLRERQKQLAESQRIAHIGSWEHNLTTGEVVWSDELFRILGLDPRKDQADFNIFLDMINPDDRLALKKAIDETVQTGKHFNIDYRFCLPDGRTRILYAQAELINNDAGDKILSGTGQDITDLKNAEYELKQSEEKFRSIVNSTDDSIYMVDRDYRYLFINNNHISRLGLPEGQYMNKAFSEFHSPEETRLFIKKVGKVFNTGNSFQYEFKSIRDDKYFLQTFSPVRNTDNEIKAVNVISKEITAFKYAEERLYSMTITDELTGLYNRRGFLTLSDQQLKQANRDNKKMFLMSSDLDYLKLINDHLGHKAGDRALTNTANILKETFRESDVIARMGGDEFIVLGMVTPYYGIQTLTKRLKENLNVHNSLADEPLEDISLSFGFALYDPSQPCSIEELLTNADELMYIDKRKKR